MGIITSTVEEMLFTALVAVGICLFSHQSTNEVRNSCQVRRLGVPSEFHFIPKIFSGVKVRYLLKLLGIFYGNLRKTYTAQ